MEKKKFFVLLSVLIIAATFAVVFLIRVFKETGSAGRRSIHYDRSIKSEYGKPIEVARVIDGDTIELINGDRLRYIGIDTPEEFDIRKPLQCFAKEAAAKNATLVERKKIVFYDDVSRRDQYGRLLGFVYLENGTFVNLELVRGGFAFAYPFPPDTSKSRIFAEAESVARDANEGLWNSCEVHWTGSGREQTNAID